MIHIALTIAGSDPSGGAGIQADLRTFQALGLNGYSSVTTITVQNSLGVQQSFPIPADLVADQITALFEDAAPDAVKIGILCNEEQIIVVARSLREWTPRFIVFDPVLVSTSGFSLLGHDAIAALRHELMPLCTLVTPNLAEAEALTGIKITDTQTIAAAGQRILDDGAQAVLIKGGHLAGDPIDTLFTRDNPPVEFAGTRIETPHTHGTGCFLSSAITSLLAQGESLEQAIAQAKALLSSALQQPTVVGTGRGFPDAATVAQSRRDTEQHRVRQNKVKGLYVLTDSQIRPDRSSEEIVQAALTGGARVIQLRDKTRTTPELIALATRLRALTKEADALLIINDRVDVALASDADGVHLGPEDMSPADARRLLGPSKIIGVSVASVAEATPLAPYASYLAVGAIYGSATKLDAGSAIGLEPLRQVRTTFPHLPIVAIGGITGETIPDVVAAGANSAAVISAVVAAPDMVAATAALQQKISCI